MRTIKIVITVFILVYSSAWADDSIKIAAFVESLRLAAPKNNDTSLYTDWKMQARAIASWTKRCVGAKIPPAKLAVQPNIARKTVTCVMGPILMEQLSLTGGNEELAVRRAAAWWMTGDTMQYQAPRLDAYFNQVYRGYLKLR